MISSDDKKFEISRSGIWKKCYYSVLNDCFLRITILLTCRENARITVFPLEDFISGVTKKYEEEQEERTL